MFWNCSTTLGNHSPLLLYFLQGIAKRSTEYLLHLFILLTWPSLCSGCSEYRSQYMGEDHCKPGQFWLVTIIGKLMFDNKLWCLWKWTWDVWYFVCFDVVRLLRRMALSCQGSIVLVSTMCNFAQWPCELWPRLGHSTLSQKPVFPWLLLCRDGNLWFHKSLSHSEVVVSW